MNIAYPGNRRLKLAIAVSVMAALLAASPAFGQGFMVKPMKLEVSARPGETVTVPLELRNTAGDAAKPLDLSLIEIAQSAEGAWMAVEKGDKAEGIPSCLKWVNLAKQSVMVEPAQAATVDVKVTVPLNARGVYFAAVIAQTRPPEGRGIRVVVRFLIPIIVEIQGRPERQKIELKDVVMSAVPQGTGTPGGSVITAKIDNEGRTYSRIKGSVKVMYFLNGRWRAVSTAEIKEVGIIPGSKLALPADLGRRLPSGKYKLTGLLYVDGRRVKPLEKEIDFEGDPAVTKLAVDTALVLDPPELAIAGAPGGMRTAVLKVENASEDEVNIEAASLAPPSLRGVAMGDLKGDDLSCAEWLEVSPAKFTLRAGGKQNIRVIAKMPKADTMQANYYGLVSLRATYADGQGAGETKTLVCVANKGVEAKPSAQAAKMTLAATEGAKYAVQARFANSGNVHFKPKCRAVIVTGQGQTVTEIELAGEEGLMLPLETREFSGEIDFEKVEPGTYALKVVMDSGSGQGAADQMPVRVTVEKGLKVVTIIAREAATSTAPAGEAVPGAGGGGAQ